VASSGHCRVLFYLTGFGGGKVIDQVTPILLEKIGELYKQKSGSRCPSEANCERFQSVGGNTREEKEINACTGPNPQQPICPMFSSKPKTIRGEQFGKADWLVNEVLNIRNQRDSGFVEVLKGISAVEAELLTNADEIFTSFERNIRIGQVEALFALTGAFGGGK
jgi:hypothetical protein